MTAKKSSVTPLPASEPLVLTEYESGFVDGYLASRGIFGNSSKEFQRALAALKRHREDLDTETARTTPYGSTRIEPS